MLEKKLLEITEKITPFDKKLLQKAKKRTQSLIMPYRALGRLHEIAEQICAIKNTLKPEIIRKCIFVMVGDHGVVEEGVSAYPQEVTKEMIKAFLKGWATINVIAKKVNSMVVVTDVGCKADVKDKPMEKECEFIKKKVVYGTKNFTKSPAMTKEEAIKTVLTGFEVADQFIKKQNLDLIATGDMGIGNTTPSTAIASLVLDEEVEKIVGKGTGISESALKIKIETIKKAISKNNPNPEDPIDILSKIGGAEIGAIAGVIIAACVNKVPIVIDGLISTAGAIIAYLFQKHTRDYMLAGHRSKEPAHIKMLNFLGLSPILDLSMRLGEGTGAALAFPIIETALEVFKNVKTFEEAGVSKAT